MRIALALLVLSSALPGADWPAFRGPNGSGLSSDAAPAAVDLDKNLAWKREVPSGVSSPVVIGDRVFLTALDGEDLVTLAFDAATGEEAWRQVAPRPRRESYHPQHGPASPTPASDGEALYVFFGDFGLISYTLDGRERWRRPLGPFSSVQGMASSPVVSGGLVVLLADQTIGGFLAAFDSDSGEETWRRERPTNFLGGYSTPVIHEPADGPAVVIAAGSVELGAYQLATGEPLWRLPGWLAPAGTPVLGDGLVYVSEPLNQAPPPFSSMLPLDKDKDEALGVEEVASFSGVTHLIREIDELHGDGDGRVVASEWNRAFEAEAGVGGMAAVPLDRSGLVPDEAVAWRYQKGLPYLSSILLSDGVVYAVRDGGVVVGLDASSGEERFVERLEGATGSYYASPVASRGRLYFASMEGKLAVTSPGPDMEVFSLADLGEPIEATPAIAAGRLFVRTHKTLYCFSEQ